MENFMTFVAKTVIVFSSQENLSSARQLPALAYLKMLGGTDADDPSVLQDLTITRFWTDKEKAQTYVNWLTAELTAIDITPVSYTLEDYTE